MRAPLRTLRSKTFEIFEARVWCVVNLPRPMTTLKWGDIPDWQQDNVYITSGYRPNGQADWRACLRSLLAIHNETFNIWSHLLGLLYFAGEAVRTFTHTLAASSARVVSAGDTLAWGIFFLGALVLLANSTLFHLGMNHSEAMYLRLVQRDYIGIAGFIWAAQSLAAFYIFYCRETVRLVVLALLTSLALGVAATMVVPKYAAPKYVQFRAGLFVAMASLGALPILYYALTADCELCWRASSFMGLSLAVFFVGAMQYAARFPERSSPPGRFDLLGHSHQALHVAVVLGMWLMYKAALDLFHLHTAPDFTCPI